MSMDVPSFARLFLYQQLWFTPPYPTYPTHECTGKTVVVTGSNVGLGLEAARHFARLNASKVILAVRTVAKGQAAAADIVTSLNLPDSRVEVWPLDMSSPDSIKTFAARANTLERLDAVVANAGIMTYEYHAMEGYESTIMVNLVGNILLALLMMPKLSESAKKYATEGKFVLAGSDSHLLADFKEQDVRGRTLFDALNSKETTNMNDRYPTSKMLLLMAIRSIGEIYPYTPDFPVVVSFCNPGLCHSEIYRDDGGQLMNLAVKVMTRLLARSTEVGSRVYIHEVVSSGKESHGQYVNNCAVARSSPYMYTEKARRTQHQVWEELIERLELFAPGISSLEYQVI